MKTPPSASPPRRTLAQLKRELASAADPRRALGSARFFKTGPGEYGAGDRFLGISTPVQRKIAHRYLALGDGDIHRLLDTSIHEHRTIALEILVAQHKRAAPERRGEIFDFYLSHTSRINNWDLVDGSAPAIVGHRLTIGSREFLDVLARSESLWERRIAIIATLPLIKKGEVEDALRIAAILLSDSHDLIHKAVGWALREVGKVARPQLLAFLRSNYAAIPRTALRYAIERFPPERRKRMLQGRF